MLSPIEMASLGHSGSHISQLMHFLVINSAIRKMGDSIYEINSDRCTECVGHYDTPTCQKVCPIPNTSAGSFRIVFGIGHTFWQVGVS
jgi:ferredoxin